MRHIIILWHILLIPILGHSQICGITEPTFVSMGTLVEIPIVIAPGDLANDDLSDPAQGLCGIEISFAHEFVTDLGLTLVSPDGQSIQLTGPTNLSTTANFTNFATWRINFVPAAVTAMPDPNISDRWNNNLNAGTFVLGGQYRGSYYPYNGDLEDFNSGSVSGTWRLVADNTQSFNNGAVLSIRLIFCDQTGVDCCFAEAGRIDDPDIIACIGDDALDLVPDNQYNFPIPDPDLYGFTFVVSRDSILQFYDSTRVDLTGMPAGTYRICGLSYLRADSLLIPQPDGQYSLADLFSDLNSFSPSFCGDLTGDCQRIIIGEPSIPVDLPAEFCEGDSYTFFDSTYTEAGTYPYTLQTDLGCDSLVNILLSMIPTRRAIVDSVICDGETVQVGNSVYNTTGIHSDTLTASNGCDSIVMLNLEVVQDIVISLDTVICQGDSLVVNGQAYFNTADFQLILPSSRVCDSIINVNLLVLNPEINLAPVDTISCARPEVLLDAGASTPLGEVTFEWRDLGGFPLGNTATLSVDTPGDYVLLVAQEVDGRRCTVSDTIRVAGNLSFPIANAGPNQTLTCQEVIITLGSGGTSTGNQYAYQWTTDTGNFLDAPDGPSPRVDAPGNYTLVVTNTRSSCSDTSIATIDAVQELPLVVTLPDTVITCINPAILLTSTGSSAGPEFAYEWRDSQDVILGNTASLAVTEGSIYRLIIRNTQSSCADSTFVSVAVDNVPPELIIGAPPSITCENNAIRLNAATNTTDPDVEIIWQTSNGGVIESDAGTLNPLVNAAGVYTLILNNTRNGCETFSSVEVADIRNTLIAAPLSPDILSCGVNSVPLNAGNSSAGANLVYEWSTADGLFVGPSAGANVLVNAAGTYTLTVLDTVSRCSDMATVQVQRDVNSPLVEAGTGFVLSCLISQDTLFGTGSSTGSDIVYNWSGPCLESSPDSLWVVASCPGMYYLEVTDQSNGCSVTDSVEVLLDQNAPQAISLPVDTITCTQAEVLLDGSPSMSAGSLQFEWTGPGGVGIATTPRIAVILPGDYQLVVIDTTNGCSDTLNLNVPINTELPVADAGPDMILNCTTLTATLGGPGTSTGDEYTNLWLAVEGDLPGVLDEPMVSVDAEGIFRLIVTNTQNGCRDSAQVIVVENNEIPGANAGTDQEINCGAEIANLNGSNSVRGADIIYEWTGPCLIGRTDSIGARADCAGTYRLAVTNTTTGCRGTDTVLVELNPAVPVVVLADTALIDCTTGTAILDGSASSLGAYEWTRDGVTVSSGDNRIEVSEAGIYVLTVDKELGNCITQDSILVLNNCRTEAVILPPDRITCRQSSIILDAGSSQGESLSYTWIAPDPDCILNGQGTAAPEVNCGGQYTLILTNTVLLQSDTQTVTVEIDDNLPVAIIGPPDTLNCVQNEVLLDGSASSFGPDIIYRWTRVSNGALIAETMNTMVQDPGTYVLEVIDTVSSCSATSSIRIVEFNLPISLTFGDSILACGQDTFALTTFATPLSDFYNYTWAGPEVLESADSATVLVGGIGNYSITVTDRQSECTATASIELIEEQQCAPCVNITTPDTLSCTQATIELEAAYCRTCTGCVLQWTTADGNILAGVNTLQPTVDRRGTYRLTVIDQQGFQTDVEVEVVADNSIPEAIAGPDRSLTCDSTAVNLGNSGTPPEPDIVYQWTSPDVPGFTNVFTSGILVDIPGTYALEVRDTISGCFSRDTVLVTYDTLPPIADAGLEQMLSCNNPFVILTGSGSSSGNDFQFNWTTSAGANCLQGADAANPIVECPGWYYLEIRNALTGCTAVDSVEVIADVNIPDLVPFPDTMLTCSQDTIELIAELADPANYAYTWCALDSNDQVISSSCINALTLSVDSSGNYLFSAINPATGCESSFTVTVADVREAPLVDAGLDLSFRCTDDSLQINATAGPDLNVLDIQWISLGNLPINRSGDLNPVVYAADTLVVIVTNRQTGCFARDTVVINQDSNAPQVDAGVDTVLTCVQTTLRLQGSGRSASGNSIRYQWTSSDGNIQANDDTPTPLINRPGTYLLTVIDDQNGCTATDAVVVRDEQMPPAAMVADLAALQFSCDLDTLLLDASGSTAGYGGPLEYQWSVVSVGSLIGDNTQSNIRVDAIGTYRLIVTEAGSGCRDSLQFTLSATVGAPSIRIEETDQLTCIRRQVEIDASASEFGTNYTATWFDEQGNILPSNGLNLSVSEPGTYSLQIDNLGTGCSNLSDPVIVTLDTLAPSVSIAPADLLDCAINTVPLDASTSSTGPDFDYQWTTAGGLLLDGVDQRLASAAAPGTYVLEISNRRNGCSAVDSVLVEAITTPIAGLALDMIAPGCTNTAGGSIIVSAVLGGTAPFVYELNGGVASTTGFFDQLSAGTYRLQVRDVNGCEWTETVIIPEALPIEVDLGLDLTISSGDSIELTAQTSSRDIVSYQWEPAVATGAVAVVSPLLSGSYAVTVTDGNGCSASDRVRVIVERTQSYYIPNAFSPNGDGNNDRFMVMTGPEVVNIPVFRIYDRWGQQVHYQQNVIPNDPQFGWDGTLRGTPLNAAVFVYYVELEYADGRRAFVQGDVALLR